MSEIPDPGTDAPSSEYIRLANEAIAESKNREALDILRQGFQRAKAQLDAGDQSSLPAYVDLVIALTEFMQKEEAIETLRRLRSRVRDERNSSGELIVVQELLYRYTREDDWPTAVRYAVALRDLHAEKLNAGAADPNLPDTVNVIVHTMSLAYQQGEYDTSTALADVAISLASDSVDAWRHLAWSCLRQQNADRAVAAFRRAIELQPGQAGLYRGLAYAYQLAGELVPAQAAMDRAIEYGGGSAVDYLSRGEMRFHHGDLAGALSDLLSVEALADDTSAPVPVSSWREMRPGPGRSAEYLRHAPVSDLRDFAAIMRVWVLQEMNRHDEAEQLTRTLILQGDQITAERASEMLADMLMDREPPRAAEAIEHYNKALQSALRKTETYLSRARAYLAAGDVPAALADLAVVCDRHETEFAVKAADLLANHIGQHGDDHDLQVSLGHCLLEARRPAEAVAALDKALAGQAADWRALMWRGLARVTVSYGDDVVAQTWNERLPVERTHAAVADLVAATLAVPAGASEMPRRALIWLVERVFFLRDSYSQLILPKKAMHRQVTSALPELIEIFRNLAAGQSWRAPHDYQHDIDLYLPARKMAIRAGFTLIAARIDLSLADNYLRMFELQRALDHIAAVEEMLPALGYIPFGVTVEERERDQADQRSGTMKVNWDLDHIGLSMLINFQVVTVLSVLRAEAVSRAGEPERAIRELQIDDDTLAEEVVRGQLQPRLGFNVVALLRNAGELDRAQQLLDKISAAAVTAGESPAVDQLRASLHARRGELAEAERILGWAVAETDSEHARLESPDPDRALSAVLGLANLAFNQRRYQDALDLLAGHPLPPNPSYRRAYSWHLLNGYCQFFLRDFRAAYRELLAVINLSDSIRGKLRDQDFKIAWHANLSEVYEKAFLAAILSHELIGIFHIMERARARAYVDQLASRETATPAASELAEAVEHCRHRRRLLRQLLAKPDQSERIEIARRLKVLGGRMAWADDSGDLPAPDPADVSAALDAESEALKKLERDLERERWAAQDTAVGPIVTLEEILRFLIKESRISGRRIVLAEYYFNLGMLTLFIATSDMPMLKFAIEYSHDEALQFAKVAFGAGATPGGGHPLFDEDKFQSLFRPLLAPIAEYSSPGDLVWIVPHGYLHHVPLHAVELAGLPLIARNPVVYTPSASVMPLCHAKAAARAGQAWDTAVVFGDSRGDLPYARDEAHAVARLFGAKAWVGAAATGAHLRDLIGPDPDVVHLACHGRFDAADAFQSGVLLARDPATPDALEQLTVEEFLGLRLNTRLVTLSACEGGVSDLRPGDELIGLTRALLHAGAPSVLVGLWSVNDLSTGFFMREFYQRVKQASTTGGGLAEALAGAQVHLMNLTAAQAVELCAERLAAATEPMDRVIAELERASAQITAGDLQAAIACHQQATQSLSELPGPLAESLLAAVRRTLPLLELRAETEVSIDYSRKPFAHPYFWAPFILIGSWQ
jgi:CHAT domain-containing protein/tetratricopeptide (TPR) repeat protein